MIKIKAPEFPESIADGEIAAWHVEVGEGVVRDQVLVDIETDKVVLEVVAPVDGALSKILKEVGATVLAEEVLAEFEAGEVSASTAAAEEKTGGCCRQVSGRKCGDSCCRRKTGGCCRQVSGSKCGESGCEKNGGRKPD